MSYNGGNAGVGVTTGPPQVYLVFWGSQWGTESTNGSGYDTFSGDPQGVAPDLQAFFKGLGTNGETWSGVMTQYCEGVSTGTFSCPNSNSEHIGYPTGGALAGVWEDTSSAAPATATGHQIGQEAENAATHFGNTTTASNRDAQYVIVSPTGTNPDNYETQGFCAWHDYTGDSYLSGGAVSGSLVAFTNLPYIPDAGAGCGAGFVNSPGTLDGVTIVEGHEYAETITDQFPAGGWTVASGANAGYENADLCAWNANPPDVAADITLSTGSFPVQPTWSNDYGSGAGGCLISHPIVTTVANVSSASGAYGGTATLTATLTSGGSGVVGRTVSFTLDGFSVGSAVTNGSGVAQLDNASLSGIGPGTYPSGVAASFGGDSSYAASAGSNSLVVGKADQAIQVTIGSPPSAAYQTGFTVAATGGGSGNPVTYGSSGGCTNNGADFTMTSGSTDCTVTYDQAGDANYNAATQVTESVTAEKGDQTITFPTQPSRTYGNADFNPGATASSGYSVSYGASGACSIVSGKVHLTGAGSCTVTADQAGDTNYNAAPQVQRTFSIGKAALSIAAAPRQKFYAEAVTLGTTAFTATGLVGSDSVSGVTLTSAGAAASAPSGNYSIAVSNAVAGPNTNLAANYTITYHTGTLNVTPVGIIGLSRVTVATTSGKIDSYNSLAGAYGPSNHSSTALVLGNGALSLAGVSLLGDAGSAQGSVSVARTASVSGSVVAGTTATILGKVGGSVMQHSPGPPFSATAVAACSPLSGKSGISGGTFTYSSGNLTVKSGTVKLASRTYCFNNVTLDSGSTLSVGGPVKIDLKGALTGNGRFANRTRLPRNLQLDHCSTASGSIRIVGNSNAYMTIFAPETPVTIAGGSFFGTVLANTVSLTGALMFHADQH